jgi:hypothetical protein
MSTPSTTSEWIRQIHRWLSIAFTLTVIANFVAMSRGTPLAWVTYSPLLPLALLLLTGLYMFALPYVRRAAPKSE